MSRSSRYTRVEEYLRSSRREHRLTKHVVGNEKFFRGYWYTLYKSSETERYLGKTCRNLPHNLHRRPTDANLRNVEVGALMFVLWGINVLWKKPGTFTKIRSYS